MIFVSVNYRLLREADPVTQAADVGHALAAVQARAAGWGGDPARILLIGLSAGAPPVAYLAADAGFAKCPAAKPSLGTVSLVSAALDVLSIKFVRATWRAGVVEYGYSWWASEHLKKQ